VQKNNAAQIKNPFQAAISLETCQKRYSPDFLPNIQFVSLDS
jgi:hypothetical protein